MTVERWSVTLDDYEASLTGFSLLLESSEAVALPSFAAPAGLGPLPSQCADRARALLQHSHELMERMQGAQEQIRGQLALVARTRTDQPSPSFVDAHA